MFLPPRMAHAILNVTENNLDDHIHGLMLRDHDLDPSGRDDELLWKYFYKQLNNETGDQQDPSFHHGAS